MELASANRRLAEIDLDLERKAETIRLLLSRSRETKEGLERFDFDMQKIALDKEAMEGLKLKRIDAEELQFQTRQELNEITAKREALESLLEREKKAHGKVLSKKEQKELEEIHRYFNGREMGSKGEMA